MDQHWKKGKGKGVRVMKKRMKKMDCFHSHVDQALDSSVCLGDMTYALFAYENNPV